MNYPEIKPIHPKKDKNYNLNMDILTSIKDIPSKTISCNNEFIDKNISPKNTCSSITTNNSSSILNSTFQNFPIPDYFRQNPNYKGTLLNYGPTNFLHSFGYFFNFTQSYPFYINPRNLYSSLYYNNNIINYNYFDLNKEYSEINNGFPKINKKNEENNTLGKNCFSNNIFLNKKRITYDNSSINQNTNNNNIKIKKEKRNKYICNHKGCDSNFRTKKLAIFHHLKMSPECQEDSISILKLIYLTKKILLKNIKNNQQSLDKYSPLYENTMKNLSKNEYIKIFAGFKINDNL